MASTKRCKQFSENSSRTHEIAPRFKRQKSFTKQTTMESNNQNQPHFPRSKKALGESYPPGSTNHPIKVPPFPREGRKIVKKLSTQKAQSLAERNCLKPQNAEQLVLSPMENKLFDLMRDTDCDYPDYFGSMDQSPLNNQMYSTTNNSNCSNQLSPVPTQWNEMAPLSIDTSLYNNNTNQSSQLQKPFQQSPNSRNTDSPHSTYSDPDIRTIEMLRELERVADQTDVGTEESNNDKNSLVSHHLRMLMCAVDRYTAGVDEEEDSDGLPASEEPQRIPSPPVSRQPYYNVPSGNNNHNHSPTHQNPFPPQHHNHQVYAPAYNNSICVPTPQPAPLTQPMGQQIPQQMLSTWNPWSTPTFNGLDVYAFGQAPASADRYYNSANTPMFFSDHANYYTTQDSSFRL